MNLEIPEHYLIGSLYAHCEKLFSLGSAGAREPCVDLLGFSCEKSKTIYS